MWYFEIDELKTLKENNDYTGLAFETEKRN